jgi:uncharacterized damage-inducible protein DinB
VTGWELGFRSQQLGAHNAAVSTRYDFLIETYRTERLKTLNVWSQVPDERMDDRIEARARSPREHMVHQCLSEDAWMRGMFGIAVAHAVLPAEEGRLWFIERYALCSGDRLAQMGTKDDQWFEQQASFFDGGRSRAWILTRRLLHSAHHRAQLQTCLRAWGVALYSTYGPSADTGGLAANGAGVIYRYPSAEAILTGEAEHADTAPLPGPGAKPVSERPSRTRLPTTDV